MARGRNPKSAAQYARWAKIPADERQAHMRPAIEASAQANGRRPWTAREDAFLREAYRAYAAPAKPPLAEIGAWIGRTDRACATRAQELGLSDIARSRAGSARTLLDRECPTCGATFRPALHSQQFCSKVCGDTGKWDRHPHPKGATGHQFTEEQIAKISAASSARWDQMTPEERRAQIQPMLDGGAAMIRDGGRPESTYTRGKGGRRADLDGRYFRSSWEANYARYLNWLAERGELLSSWDYEPVTFEFPVKRGTRFYTPDFRVHLLAGGYEWHEVKGWLTQQGATALKRFALHHPAESERLVMIDGPVYRPLAASVKAFIPNWE